MVHSTVPTDDDRASTAVTKTYDRDAGEQPSEAVVAAVAEATDRDKTDLRPLFERVDPDALDRLFAPTAGDAGRASNGRVRFRFEGCDVSIHADGRAVATPRD